jgi:hypothetical protein
MSEIVKNVSGVIMVSCEGSACEEVVKRAKSQIKVVTEAFRVLKTKSSDDISVIINMDAVSKKQILDAKDDVLKLDGVKSIKYRIAD